jgi:hypothetical protein
MASARAKPMTPNNVFTAAVVTTAAAAVTSQGHGVLRETCNGGSPPGEGQTGGVGGGPTLPHSQHEVKNQWFQCHTQSTTVEVACVTREQLWLGITTSPEGEKKREGECSRGTTRQRREREEKESFRLGERKIGCLFVPYMYGWVLRTRQPDPNWLGHEFLRYRNKNNPKNTKAKKKTRELLLGYTGANTAAGGEELYLASATSP